MRIINTGKVRGDPELKDSRVLTTILVFVTIVVAAATIWLACNFVDSLHDSVQATKNIHIKEDTKIPERGKFDAISPHFSKQIESMPMTPTSPPKVPAHLSKSEILYEQALKASGTAKYSEAVSMLTKALKLIPEESKNQEKWFAAGESHDIKMYLALTYQCRSFCYLNLREYKKAISDLDQAIARRPAYGPNFTNRSKAHYLLGEQALGYADLKRARQLPAIEEDPNEHTLDELADDH